MTNAIEFYSGLAGEWEDKYRRPSLKRRAEAIFSLLEARVIAGTTWLDAGCGSGYLARGLSARGARVVGVDASQAMLDVAERAARGLSALSFKRIDTIQRLEFDAGTFDGVLCSSVLEYVDDPMASVRELARVLKPGGSLFMSIPTSSSVLRLVQRFTHFSSATLRMRPWPEYIAYSHHAFSRRQAVQLVEAAGLTLASISGFDPVMHRAPLLAEHMGSLFFVIAEKAAP